jgi:hypothetical protein
MKNLKFNASFVYAHYFYVSIHKVNGIIITNWPLSELNPFIFITIDQSDLQFFVNGHMLNDLNCSRNLSSKNRYILLTKIICFRLIRYVKLF